MDLLVRHRHIQGFLEDERAGAPAIAARYGVSLGDCGYKWADQSHALIRAIFVAERLATPYLAGQLRAGAIRLSGYAGLPPPDISVGVGRIRLSTARKHLSKSPPPEMRHYALLSDRALANALLDRCHAFRIGLTILDNEKRQYTEHYESSNALFIRHVARAYAGKAHFWTTAEAALSHEIYYRLVYHLFQIYRFQGPCRTALDAEKTTLAEPHEPCGRSNPRGPYET